MKTPVVMCQNPHERIMDTRLKCIRRAEFYASANSAASFGDSAVIRVAGQLAQIGDAFSNQYKKSLPRHRKQKRSAFESVAIEICIYVALHVLIQLH